MRFRFIKAAIERSWEHIGKHHTLQMAAALSYYFVMSIFPALILLSAVVTYLPVPDLFNEALTFLGRFIPPESMGLVRQVLADVVSPNRGTFLGFGLLGTLWATSGGFVAAIEALDIAYDVEETRPFWKTRPLAIGLTLLIGGLLLAALFVMILGPHFGDWLSKHARLDTIFIALWPTIHWTIAIVFAVLAIEAIYFLAPNVKQRFFATLPGAILAVAAWIVLSYGLGYLFRSFVNLNKTYGTLGATVSLMVWLYWTSFAMLVGAELNSELAKRSRKGRIPEKQEPPPVTSIRLSA